MDRLQLADDLASALVQWMEEQYEEDVDVRTYSEVGMLTTDAGFVVRTQDGDEFQVTVVPS